MVQHPVAVVQAEGDVVVVDDLRLLISVERLQIQPEKVPARIASVQPASALIR